MPPSFFSSKVPSSSFTFSNSNSSNNSSSSRSAAADTTSPFSAPPSESHGKSAASLATTTTTTTTPTTDHRQRLVDFYTRHNPEKLATLDMEKLLSKYAGREEELFAKLAATYTSSFPSPSGNGPTYFLDTTLGRIVVKVYADKLPMTSANFGTLVTGTPIAPANRSAQQIVTFRNTPWHRIVPGLLIQGGDTTLGNGRGGRSAFDVPVALDMWGKFKDEEPFLAHDRAGLLSMANSGKNTNSSQFFITLRAMSHLNGKHVVFGEVIEGMHVVRELGQLPTNKEQRPLSEAKIIDCGKVEEERESSDRR